MKVINLLTHKTKKLVEKHGYLSTSMLTKTELFALKRGVFFGQKQFENCPMCEAGIPKRNLTDRK